MNGDASEKQGMSAFAKIIGIFSSPTETFKQIDERPTWLLPFIIMVVVILASQFLLLDISLTDRLAIAEARDLPAEQMQAARAQMEGPMKYIGFAFMPIGLIIVWVVIAAVFLFAGNVVMGGKTQFKKLLAVVAWTSLIGIVQVPLYSFLVYSKGTTHGVTTSLAALLPLHAIGEKPALLYQILSKFDIFPIWQLILWILGVSVVYKFTVKKSATMIVSIWVIYIIFSIALGQIFGGMFGA
ncbi:YIP1 family protein [bacterium]|nr:YIP1 family protein [bacterium]